MNKILYCPWCEKYVKGVWYSCPFCSAQTIYIKAWDKKSDEEKKEWLKKFPKVDTPRPIKDKSLLREAEKFDKQARAELAQEEARKQYIPRCPTCGCPDVERVGFGEKIVDTAVWGFLARKPKCQFRCKNCGYEW